MMTFPAADIYLPLEVQSWWPREGGNHPPCGILTPPVHGHVLGDLNWAKDTNLLLKIAMESMSCPCRSKILCVLWSPTKFLYLLILGFYPAAHYGSLCAPAM